MGVSIGYRLKAIAMVLALGLLFLTIFTSTQPARVEARANLTAYLSVPPTDWEPFGRYVPATTGWYITHTLGWYNVTLMGNLGIGDGSERTLNNSSNQDVNYTANNFMAADISTEPWDRSRLTSAPPLYPAPAAAEYQTNQTTAEAENATATNATSTGSAQNNSSEMPGIGNSSLKMPDKINLDLTSWLSSEKGGIGSIGSSGTGNGRNTSSGSEGNASASGGGNLSENATTAPESATTPTSTTPVFSNLGPNVPLNDVYHPMLMGRPIDDLFYEYPLANSVTMYARLVGLRIASGPPINMGIACLGYGY